MVHICIYSSSILRNVFGSTSKSTTKDNKVIEEKTKQETRTINEIQQGGVIDR
jgi:hypothetical protein